MASFLIRACSFPLGSKGALVERSSTSSTPMNKPAPANVAHMGMIAETLAEPTRQMRAHGSDIVEKLVAADDLLNGKCCRAGHRMAEIGVTVLEEPRAV